MLLYVLRLLFYVSVATSINADKGERGRGGCDFSMAFVIFSMLGKSQKKKKSHHQARWRGVIGECNMPIREGVCTNESETLRERALGSVWPSGKLSEAFSGNSAGANGDPFLAPCEVLLRRMGWR